ncbi:Zinc finger protein 474 [Labeo rohita]|uniref:Zinc finger protein 474 n=1 Tax=Labeo rohita TaxID=84645 RepID=A0ABQ8LAK2_LABRO|nr:Zinc finger protein 474 [Labeo rohita]
MGVKALETHMRCEKHKVAAETCRKKHPVYQFCSVEPTIIGLTQSAAASQTSATALQLQALRFPLQQTSEQRLPLPQHSEPRYSDSEIARTFKCGKDKTAYIARFGLAPYITKLLVADVNKEMFVLMFDESLNETSKTNCGGELWPPHPPQCLQTWLLHLEKVLRALHILFHNAPARREDFTALTKCTKFPLPFCGHNWLENLPVVERALEVCPSVTMYMDAVRKKKIPNPGTASYDTPEAAEKDPLILAKLHFYMAITRTFSPFLTFYQTDVPVIPFLAKDLAELLKSMLRCFVKKEELQKQKKIRELTVLEFRKDCLKMMSTIIQKVQEKSPLKYPVVRQVACLDPSMMLSDPDWCKSNMTKLVQKFLQAQQLSGGVSAGDVIIQQFSDMLSAENATLVSYRSTETRLDTFLHGVLDQRYDELWGFCKKLLLLSHGQATVERGFSINKEVETCNMQEETMVTHRLVCDYVNICGGLLNVPISKELLASAASARSRYRIHLDQQKAKKITDVPNTSERLKQEPIAFATQQEYNVAAAAAGGPRITMSKTPVRAHTEQPGFTAASAEHRPEGIFDQMPTSRRYLAD